MWSWHWSPFIQTSVHSVHGRRRTSLLLSPFDRLASFLETTLANGVKVVEKVIASKFRFHLIAIYALGCFRNFSCTLVTVPKLPWRAPTPVRLVKEWILMLLIKKPINLKTVYIWEKKCHKMYGPPLCHLGQWLNILLAQKKKFDPAPGWPSFQALHQCPLDTFFHYL
jgi:hypothetical protein